MISGSTTTQEVSRKAIIEGLTSDQRLALTERLSAHLESDRALAVREAEGKLLLEYLTCHMTPAMLAELVTQVGEPGFA